MQHVTLKLRTLIMNSVKYFAANLKKPLPKCWSKQDAGIFDNGGKEAVDVDKAGESEIVMSCEEALHNLEAAAENAVQSFSRLATLNIGEDESKRFERLDAVERKIKALAKLLHPSSNGQG